MFDRIVVPLDLSSESRQAIACAEEFACAGSVPLELLNVVDPLRRAEVEPVLTRRAARSSAKAAVRIIESVDSSDSVLAEELMADDTALWFIATHARGAL